jgi:hypothetical protein
MVSIKPFDVKDTRFLSFFCKTYNCVAVCRFGDLTPTFHGFSTYESRSLLDAAGKSFDSVCKSHEQYLELMNRHFEKVSNLHLQGVRNFRQAKLKSMHCSLVPNSIALKLEILYFCFVLKVHQSTNHQKSSSTMLVCYT